MKHNKYEQTVVYSWFNKAFDHPILKLIIKDRLKGVEYIHRKHIQKKVDSIDFEFHPSLLLQYCVFTLRRKDGYEHNLIMDLDCSLSQDLDNLNELMELLEVPEIKELSNLSVYEQLAP